MPAWLEPDFMQRAVLAGVLVALLTSYLGTFIVQRGMSFLGSGLAHAAFGGVALALLIENRFQEVIPAGFSVYWITIPFTLAIAIAITWVQQRTSLGADTAIGIFFSVAFALGVVFMTAVEGFAANPMSYLFGSILLVTPADLWAAGIMLAICALLAPLWSRWTYATFDRELAQADRIPVEWDDYILVGLVAVSIVVSIKLVGIVMISAFLVIPPASARLVAATFPSMTAIAAIISVASAIGGIRASHAYSVPPGASMILVAAIGFVACLLIAAITPKSKRERPANPAPPATSG